MVEYEHDVYVARMGLLFILVNKRFLLANTGGGKSNPLFIKSAYGPVT